MSEFKKGQIVYVSDDGENWHVSHYVGAGHDNVFVNSDKEEALGKNLGGGKREMCLSVEDYHEMVIKPKDKDLCWAWDIGDEFGRDVRFYDALNDCVFYYDGCRSGSSYDNYEVIPKDHWPEWAVDAYPKLET